MRIVQVCAFSNWLDESFEVWKWFKANEKSGEITRKMESLFLNLFAKVMITKSSEDLRKANRTIGLADISIDVSKKQASLILPHARFFHYLGRCLNEENKSYFAPYKTVTAGLAEIKNNSMKIMKTREKSKPVSDAELELIRKLFGKESENIEIKRAIDSLGNELDVLFDWKKKFRSKIKT